MIATTEPLRVNAGDTVVWLRSLSDYPASDGWVLNYRLINAAGKIDITAAASGSDHAVNVSALNSSAWVPGSYSWIATVTKGVERHTVDRGNIVVAPDLSAQAGGFETRSHAQQILDGLQSAYASAVIQRAFVQEYEIAGRRMKFNDKAAWLLEINFWKREVASEKRAQRLAAGLDAGNKVYVRF